MPIPPSPHIVTLTGFEPIIQESNSCVLPITLQGIIVLHAGFEPASSDRKSDILTTRRMEQKSADENYQLNSRYFTIDSRVVLAMRNSTL